MHNRVKGNMLPNVTKKRRGEQLMIGYHFTAGTLRNGQPLPRVGEWLEHRGDVIPCESGLHASIEPFDALTYAPGAILHLVELEQDLQSHGNPIDKWVGRRRKILASIEVTDVLREFAREQALSVIYLWDAPDVVREYLTTGREELRAAAWEAAKATSAWEATAWAATATAAWAAATAAWEAAAWTAAWAARATSRESFNERIYHAFGEKP